MVFSSSFCLVFSYYHYTSFSVVILKVPISGSRKQHYTGNLRNQLLTPVSWMPELIVGWKRQEAPASFFVVPLDSTDDFYAFSFVSFIFTSKNFKRSEKSSDRNIHLLCLFVNNSKALVRLASAVAFRSYCVNNVLKQTIYQWDLYWVQTILYWRSSNVAF